MPYEIQFEPEWFKLRFHGTIDSIDLQLSLADVEEIEATRETAPDRITDLSASETTLWSFRVIEELAARRRAARLRNPIKSAIYAPSDLHFGFSRMFQLLNDNPQIEVSVFRDLESATKWLRNRSTQDNRSP